ncbi:MAG: PEP-CTERM sorting domain-containing protein [Rubrivivax sp.]|nr:PEP-CTERM sorting domain-containing protein [Rubrivivax sp.]
MKSIKQTLRLWALTTTAAAAFLGVQAQAAPTVSIDPASQTIAAVGGTASVNIVVSGLTDPLGGFGLNLSFNGAILKGLSFTNDPDSKMGGASGLDMSCGFDFGGDPSTCTPTPSGSSPLDLFFVADANLDEAELAALQGDTFVLATITFEGLANGLSPLRLSNVVLSNWNGDETIAGVGTRNGEICVGGNCNNVPEPGSMVLVGTAFGALALLRRRRSISSAS